MPLRIQRKRTKGWRMPAGCVCVTRPGKHGNPFTVRDNRVPGSRVSNWHYRYVPTVEDSLECFRLYVHEMLTKDPGWLDELRNKDLACWCKLCEKHRDGKPFDVECPDCDPCHADVLLEISNR